MDNDVERELSVHDLDDLVPLGGEGKVRFIRVEDVQQFVYGRFERCFRRVLELEPSNPVARLGLERLGVSPDPT